MNTSQLLHLIDELQKVSLDLLDVSMTTSDKQAGIKVGESNLKLCEITNVLVNHLVKQEEEL